MHLDKNVGRRGSRSKWIWSPKRGTGWVGLELNLHLDRLRTDNWWPKVELVQTLLGKWLAQGSPREIPFQRFPVSDVTGHCQLGNPGTPPLWAQFASLCPFSSSEWEFPEEPLLQMEMHEVCPHGRKINTTGTDHKKPSCPHIPQAGADNTYPFPRTGGDANSVIGGLSVPSV